MSTNDPAISISKIDNFEPFLREVQAKKVKQPWKSFRRVCTIANARVPEIFEDSLGPPNSEGTDHRSRGIGKCLMCTKDVKTPFLDFVTQIKMTSFIYIHYYFVKETFT